MFSTVAFILMTLVNLSRKSFGSIVKGSPKGSLIVNPDGTHKSLIWMHGLGDTPHGFADIFSYLAPKTIRIVLLQAPTRPVTLNMGAEMPAWYDIEMTRQKEDSDGILKSAQIIDEVIETEIERHNNESTNVFIGGFSQGGAMALHCGYHYKQKLGGIISLSSYVLKTSKYPDEINENNKDTKLYYCHGTNDAMIPISHAKESLKSLSNIDIKYEEIDGMGHEVNPNEIKNVCWFVQNGNFNFPIKSDL